MLYYNFKNYEEFKNLFGIVKHGNNHESRKNKILLAYLKIETCCIKRLQPMIIPSFISTT